jgi:hypothetical protein
MSYLDDLALDSTPGASPGITRGEPGDHCIVCIGASLTEMDWKSCAALSRAPFKGSSVFGLGNELSVGTGAPVQPELEVRREFSNGLQGS